MNYTLDHLHFRCSQLQSSVDWFKEKLGAEEKFRGEVRGNLSVGMALAGATLLLTAAPVQASTASSNPIDYGLWHFGLKVSNLNEAVAELKAKEVRFTMEPTLLPNGVKIAFIEGPDNISIELVQRP